MATTAGVTYLIVVKSTLRDTGTTFKPTKIITQRFKYTTDTASYSGGTSGTAGTDIYNYCNTQAGAGWWNTVMISITIDNVTAPISGKGVVNLPKQHLDCALSSDEVTAGSVVTTLLNTKTADLITRAAYN